MRSRGNWFVVASIATAMLVGAALLPNLASGQEPGEEWELVCECVGTSGNCYEDDCANEWSRSLPPQIEPFLGYLRLRPSRIIPSCCA